MAEDIAPGTVLVTGGSGYLGSWIAVGLLRRGYRVRATIRNLARQDEVRAMIASEVDPGDRLSFVAADLLKDDGWDAAAQGADYVMHVASPMPIGEFRGHDVIRPAREGTRRVLTASAKAGVKRVVLTSSMSAATPKDKERQVSEETVWTDVPDKPAFNYARAKTLAEQDAWAFVREEGRGMELATVLPSQIQGPVLGSDFSASVGVIAMMLRGKMPVLPRIGFGIVDVRDLVDIHILAMTEPQAAGERFLATGDFLWFTDIARILREKLGARADKVPTRKLPDLVVRIGALFNPEMAQMAPNLGIQTKASIAKAERLLGWKPRPAAESIVDAANSLIAHGLA
ncbi:SDR family oxidoreductase [Sphingomonas bacterium]|uniref:SDR family oxidoreductase n=1 Tax=Sphingomonas bacterium TaxID=1895847 RepID=UPI001575EABE|nr:aldehyde reductase [Sphingomonas bacterium]